MPTGSLPLRAIPHRPLVPEREDANFRPERHEAVERDEARGAERDNEFPDIPVDAPSGKRVIRQQARGRADDPNGLHRRCGILASDHFEGVLNVIEGPGGEDYRRHGLGRGARGVLASRCIQASTSSAR